MAYMIAKGRDRLAQLLISGPRLQAALLNKSIIILKQIEYGLRKDVLWFFQRSYSIYSRMAVGFNNYQCHVEIYLK